MATDGSTTQDLLSHCTRITVAAVSCLIRPGDPEANLRQIGRWSGIAARQGADIVLFNETSATGYWMDPRIRSLAEPLDGPIVKRIESLARRNRIVIAAGLAEAADGRQYNTHVLVGPEGVLGFHRKSSFPEGEDKFFDLGSDYNAIQVRGSAIGIAICYESVHPETCRRLAENGARLILAPYHNAVTAAEIMEGKRSYFSLRARENRVWYVACDQCSLSNGDGTGSLVPGAVCFVSPEGDIVAVTSLEETGEHIIVRELDLDT